MNNHTNNKGLVIAELIDKTIKKDKNKDTYWILKLSICKRLTEMYFELRNEQAPTLSSNDKPLYVFPNKNKNRFAYTLTTDCIYLFWYSKSQGEDAEFLHVEDWRKLANDRRSIERSYRALLSKKDDLEEEEEELTNQELLLELKKRIKQKKIIFNLQAQNSEADGILASIDDQIDADLKDQESFYP